MKYVTILELGNNECPNVGTIKLENNKTLINKFKEAIESHFDAKLCSFTFVDSNVINKLDDCINAAPIDVLVNLDVDGIVTEYQVELSETWLY